MKVEPTTVAKKIASYRERIAAAAAAMQAEIESLTTQMTELEDPGAFDEVAAQAELTRAITSDAIEGTDAASKLKAEHAAQREAIVKQRNANGARRVAAKARIAELQRAIEEAKAQSEDAAKLQAGEVEVAARKALEAEQGRYAELLRSLIKSAVDLIVLRALRNDSRQYERTPRTLAFELPAIGLDVSDLTTGPDRFLIFRDSEFGGHLNTDREGIARAIYHRHLELRKHFAGEGA